MFLKKKVCAFKKPERTRFFRLNEFDQFLDRSEPVVVSVYSLTVIDNSVPLQAVQKLFFSVSPEEDVESTGFDLLKKSFGQSFFWQR